MGTYTGEKYKVGTIIISTVTGNEWEVLENEQIRCLKVGKGNGDSWDIGDITFMKKEHGYYTVKKTTMKKLQNYFIKMTDANTQMLAKMGYINGDLEPTEKAKDALIEIAFFANKDALVERAKAEEAEETKSKE